MHHCLATKQHKLPILLFLLKKNQTQPTEPIVMALPDCCGLTHGFSTGYFNSGIALPVQYPKQMQLPRVFFFFFVDSLT